MSLTEDPVKDADYTDHEVSMAKSQMLSSMKSINRIAKHLSTKSESEGLEGWTASKLTMAEDYLQVVADYFDGQEINEGFKIRDKSRGYGVADKTYKTREEAKKAAIMKAAMTGGDWEVIEEGYKVMPPMDPKYVARKGLEGPFSTLSGKVVYYDPKEGKYYDPDTDMYMSYEEFQNYDKDYSGMKDERDEVKEADETKYGIIRYPDTAISYIKNDGNGWEHIFDKSYGFEGPVDKADLKYAKKIAKEKIPSRMFGMKDERDEVNEAHQIDWPDEDMEQHAYNAINHGMHAYDAFDHVFSMTADHRDWLRANKDEIIKMFAQYGLQTESLEEAKLSPEQREELDDLIDMVKYGTSPSTYDPDAMDEAMKALKIIRSKFGDKVADQVADGIDNFHFPRHGMHPGTYGTDRLASKKPTQIKKDGKIDARSAKSTKRDIKSNLRDMGKKDPKRLGEQAITEAEFDEAAGEKDDCYHKVKSRYKVWPSAYASGALVKCRKVGAKNWGNSKKK